MNEKLNDLFYKEKLGLSSQATFINQVKNKYPDIKLKEIKEYLKNQEINQITTDNKKTYNYKITAPPRTFQIDIFWFRRGETLKPILLLVDILSRKAFFYMLSKKTQENILDALKLFKNEVGEINGLEGDNEFSKTDIKQFCQDNNIRLDTSVSKEEHISKGNKLGIIDRLVRTLRELIEKYYNSCWRAAFCDRTVRSALSPPHTSRAPGAATQDQAGVLDSRDTRGIHSGHRGNFGKAI